MKADGDCYFTVGKMVLDEVLPISGTSRDDYRIIHAKVSGQGSLTGTRYGHAWLEFNDALVIDKSNGNDIVMPKRLYYKIGKINPNNRREYFSYSWSEAKDKSLSIPL